jgi:catechol 2,3-dioxygenase-like lactoylglutathione lyase family enzyme
MQRVTGIGGIFFKARDVDGLRAWYRRHLGLDIQEWGGIALAPAPTQPAHSKSPLASHTTWCVFPADSDYFGPTCRSSFMINYRVVDLDALLKVLRLEGCLVDDKTEVSEYGKFGWVTDPEGNRVELWQPPRS